MNTQKCSIKWLPKTTERVGGTDATRRFQGQCFSAKTKCTVPKVQLLLQLLGCKHHWFWEKAAGVSTLSERQKQQTCLGTLHSLLEFTDSNTDKRQLDLLLTEPEHRNIMTRNSAVHPVFLLLLTTIPGYWNYYFLYCPESEAWWD